MVANVPQPPTHERYPVVPDRLHVKPGESLRFGVGDLSGLHSAIWWVKAQKSRDVFIGARTHKHFKISLHQSGKWRAGWTSEGAALFGLDPEGEDRALNKFDEAADFSPGMKLALSILVPMSSLHVNPEATLKGRNAVSWWPRIAASETISFDVLLLEPNAQEIVVRDAFIGTVGNCTLPDGYSIRVYARVVTDPDLKTFLWQKRFMYMSKLRPGRPANAFSQGFEVGSVAGVPAIIDHGDNLKPSLF